MAHQKRFDEAIAEIDRGIADNPNDAVSYIVRSNVLHRAGDNPAAEAMALAAMRLNPHYGANYLGALGQSYFGQKRFAEAVGILERAADRDTDFGFLIYDYLAASYGHLGQLDQAKAATDKSNKRNKELGRESITLGNVGRWITFKVAADRELLREGLRKAGVPGADRD